MFVAALVEGHLSYTSVVVALSRLRSGASLSVSISAATPHVDPRLGVCVRDVEAYRLVAVLWQRSVSEASPLDHYIHAEVPVGVIVRSASHFMTDG